MRRVKVFDTYLKMIDLDAIISTEIVSRRQANNKIDWWLELNLSGGQTIRIEYSSYTEAQTAALHLIDIISAPDFIEDGWDPYYNLHEDNEDED